MTPAQRRARIGSIHESAYQDQTGRGTSGRENGWRAMVLEHTGASEKMVLQAHARRLQPSQRWHRCPNFHCARFYCGLRPNL